jgi:hypothetical protein
MATTRVPVERTAPDRLYIGGEWVDAADGGRFATLDPSTGESITDVAEAGAADVDRAVSAARSAFEDRAWGGMSASDRGVLLWRIADAIQARADELARIETLDNGKPIREAQISRRRARPRCRRCGRSRAPASRRRCCRSSRRSCSASASRGPARNAAPRSAPAAGGSRGPSPARRARCGPRRRSPAPARDSGSCRPRCRCPRRCRRSTYPHRAW